MASASFLKPGGKKAYTSRRYFTLFSRRLFSDDPVSLARWGRRHGVLMFRRCTSSRMLLGERGGGGGVD